MPKNDHFRAADAMAALLPHIHTRNMKHEQQKAILRELIAGLKYGLPIYSINDLAERLTVATPGAAVEIRAKNRSVFTDDVEF